MHNLPIRRLLAAALLLALTASSACEAGSAPAPSPTTSPAKAVPKQSQARPGLAGEFSRLTLRAEGRAGARNGAIWVLIDDAPVINRDEALPWHEDVSILNTNSLEFHVTLVDLLSGKGQVKCWIYDRRGKKIEEGEWGAESVCLLAPMVVPA
jgi:hypothetical protein